MYNKIIDGLNLKKAKLLLGAGFFYILRKVPVYVYIYMQFRFFLSFERYLNVRKKKWQLMQME